MDMKNRVVHHYTKDFNRGKDRTILIYDDDLTKKSIPAKIPEEYGALTQLLTENKITTYKICENYPHIYEIYFKVLERIIFESDQISSFSYLYFQKIFFIIISGNIPLLTHFILQNVMEG
jgi:hypothetical protein